MPPAPHPPTPDEISRRAYFLWEASPFHDSDPVEDWLRAERELWDKFNNGLHPDHQVKEQLV